MIDVLNMVRGKENWNKETLTKRTELEASILVHMQLSVLQSQCSYPALSWKSTNGKSAINNDRQVPSHCRHRNDFSAGHIQRCQYRGFAQDRYIATIIAFFSQQHKARSIQMVFVRQEVILDRTGQRSDSCPITVYTMIQLLVLFHRDLPTVGWPQQTLSRHGLWNDTEKELYWPLQLWKARRIRYYGIHYHTIKGNENCREEESQQVTHMLA